MLARLEACWQKWPRPLARAARGHLVSSSAARQPARGEAAHLQDVLRYPWLLLPAWLLAKCRPEPAQDDRVFLADILWGQFALFLFVRIHDDLVDRQASSPWLIYVADRYLVESEQAFAAHLHDRRFWSIFRQCLADTLDGIAEADALQRMKTPRRKPLLAAYARVSSIFKVGSAAVLTRYARMKWYPAISTFKDDLAIVSQILDDLDDVREDLAQGRRNYAASSIAAHSTMEDGLASMLDELEWRLRSAQQVVAPLRLTDADGYVAQHLRRLDRLRDQAHRAHVRRVFSRRRSARAAPLKRRRA